MLMLDVNMSEMVYSPWSVVRDPLAAYRKNDRTNAR